MSSASASSCLTIANRWQLGSLVLLVALLGFGIALASLILFPSMIVLHGLLGCYLQVFGSALLCIGVFLFPQEIRGGTDCRVCALCCALLSPFATWAAQSTGHSYLSVNGIFWQFFAFACIRMVIRLYAQESGRRGFVALTSLYHNVYWLFLFFVFAPFCARALDAFGISYVSGDGPVRVGDLWNSQLFWLDVILKASLLLGVFAAALCSLLVILRFQDVPARSCAASGESESTSSKEQETDGDDIDSGVGCVQ